MNAISLTRYFKSQFKIFLLLSTFFTLILYSVFAQAADETYKNKDRISTYKYPYVHYDDVVFTDNTRERNGAKYSGSGTPVNGFRLIDVRIYRPAVAPGSGDPAKISFEPVLYNGTYANHPLVTTDQKALLAQSWTDNANATGPFPILLMFGGGAQTSNIIKFAENVAAAGFIVVVPTGYGTDVSTCPASFCATAIARTSPRDARVVITAIQNGSVPGLPYSDISKDSNGQPIVGCVGGSAGGVTCLQASAGFTTADANSLPGELQPDSRIKAVMSGDIYVRPSAVFNPSQFNANLAIFNSGLGLNWTNDFSLWNNAKTRIYYEILEREHRGIAFDSNVICNLMSENIRVYQNGLNTPRDNALIPGLQLATISNGFAHCSPQDLTGFQVLPLVNPPLPSNLIDLLPFAPLSGVPFASSDNTYVSPVDDMSSYYVSNFMLATLNNDSEAYTRAITPSFRGYLNQIYVDSVPGTEAHNFNLQNTQIDIKLVDGKKYMTTITPRSGAIPDPSIAPNAVSVFGNTAWDSNIAQVTPAFDFPFIKNNLISKTSTIDIHSNGYVLPESYMVFIDGAYAAKRLNEWFGDRGSMTIAALGNDLKSPPTLSPNSPDGKVWASSTPERLQITWYKVQSWDFPAVSALSAQVTLFPDGSIRLEYDNTIPNVIPATPGSSDAIVVGLSNGRVHANGSGKNIPTKKGKVVTFTDVMNGQSTSNADAIYEVYTAGIEGQSAPSQGK